MNLVLRYADPAGNITAIVESPVHPEDRVSISKAILALGKAEQVGFAVSPLLGGDGRLQMMGGEFCGNAARSFGYLLATERYSSGQHRISVEISGADAPLSVTADLHLGTAAAEMPLPLGMSTLTVAGQALPLVELPGICHVILEGQAPSYTLVQQVLDAARPLPYEAIGVMFLERLQLTPAVYVRSTDSLVWESSCGSGSTACGWYLSQEKPQGEYTYAFSQPGGTIQVAVTSSGQTISKISMGGPLTLSLPVSLTL